MDEVAVVRESIQPFWRKLQFFLKFPLKLGPFTFILLMTVMAGLVVFVSAWLKAILLVFFLRYAFSVMEMGSRGRFDPKLFEIPVWGTGDKRPFKQTILFFFYGVILMVLANLAGKQKRTAPVVAAKPAIVAVASAPVPAPAPAPASALASTVTLAVASATSREATQDDDDKTASAQSGAEKPVVARKNKRETHKNSSGKSGLWASVMGDPDRHLTPLFFLLAILCALPLPASVMVIAIDNSLGRAMNIRTFFFFVKAMGRAYFVLWIFFALIFLGREGMLQLLPETWSPFITAPLEMFFTFYFLLALYSMMGYALYQFHQQLGADVHVDFETHLANEAHEIKMQAIKSINK